MKKALLYIFCGFIFPLWGYAQLTQSDSLKLALRSTKNDTTAMLLSGMIANTYVEINFDSLYVYAGMMLQKAEKLKLQLEEATAKGEIGYAWVNMGNYPRALQTFLEAIAICSDAASEKKLLSAHYPVINESTNRSLSPRLQRLERLARVYQYTGILYANSFNYEKADYYYREGIRLSEECGDSTIVALTYATLGRSYNSQKKPDSALLVLTKAYTLLQKEGYKKYLGTILLNLGRAYLQLGKKDSALAYFHLAIPASETGGYPRGVAATDLAISDLYMKEGLRDSGLYYLKMAFPYAHEINAPDLFVRIYSALANHYKSTGNNDSAVKYQSLIIKTNDSLFGAKQLQQFQNIDYDEEQRIRQMEKAKEEYRNKLRTNILFAGLGIFLIIALLLWRNSRQRRVANIKLSRQKKQLEETLYSLKATQAQLIQSEKMASLGELTAGIAHEIQNPLNFVNNFSEVNSELISELKDAVKKGDKTEAENIASTLDENEQKIIFHGKRADAIVKGMLQHSRSSTGQKEPTDINKLTDEYLRLSYHGLRARDKSFNASFNTSFDQQLGKVNVIPQDLGRVLLNLINNAFYAVTEKRKRLLQEGKAEGFMPTVLVKTRKANDGVEITVEDNGDGIPQKIMDKIFQPFFTTKPTGEGTGLGLSLSYDIIKKAHGGDLKAETEAGQGTKFIIQLPDQ